MRVLSAARGLAAFPQHPAAAPAIRWCGALACLGAWFLTGGCATPTPGSWHRYEYTRPEMGMPFRIVLYAPDAHTAESAAIAALDRVHALNQIFSDYEDDSELTLLCRTAGQGRAVPLSAPLWDILRKAQDLARRSDGAFDVTAGPLVQLWRRARRQQALPRREALEQARRAVGQELLVLDRHGRTARLTAPGMRLDLGAIAKGYAIDEALRTLQARGIRSALVGCGGDMAFGDAPPGARGWRIELAALDAPDAPPARSILLARAAMATSGDLFQHVEIEGQRYSHIIDPRTGFALTDHSLVVVVAPNCAQADSLATTFSVLGPEAAMRLRRALGRIELRMVRQPGHQVEITESPGFRRHYAP